MTVTQYRLLPNGGREEVATFGSFAEASEALRKETEAIPPRPRSSFSRAAKQLYDLAVGMGVINPYPVYGDGYWYLEGGNLGGDCLGFCLQEAIACLKRGEFVHGGKIELR